MEKSAAISIQNQLKLWSQHSQSSYSIDKLEFSGNTLKTFHQWANGKQTIAAFKVTNPKNETFYLLLIDWHRNENYYLVIYLHDKSSTAAEIHHTEEDSAGISVLLWTYTPFPFPQATADTEDFLNQIFTLARNRLRIDRIAELFNL